MKIIYAPNEYFVKQGEIPCFMAGGLQKCDWHDRFLTELEKHSLNHLVLYNPKRSVFDMSDPNESAKQIAWEFRYLNVYLDQPWIFSMYFDNSESPQPICFYELGRYIALLYQREDYSAIVSINPGFSREQDVRLQTILATSGKTVPVHRTPEEHAIAVVSEYASIKARMK